MANNFTFEPPGFQNDFLPGEEKLAQVFRSRWNEDVNRCTGDTHLDKMLQNQTIQISNDSQINAFEQKLLDELNKIIDNEEVLLEVDDSPKGLLATIVKDLNLEELQSKFPQKNYMRVNKKEIEYSFVDGQEPIKIQL
jgi:hypothetical protein